MMKRILVSASLAAAVATFVVAGCGGSSSNGNTPGGGNGNDASTGNGDDSGNVGVPTPGKDGGGVVSDAGLGNPPLPDGSVLPHGNQLAAGTTLVLDGVTSDDYVVYTDTATNTAYAISLAAGSKAISLGTVDTSNDVAVRGKVVFLGTSSDQNGVGAASVWTSAATAPAPLSTSTFVSQGGVFAVSADGAHVAFLDGIDANATTASISVASADGTGKTALVASVDIADNVCFPEIGFAGAYAVAAYCEGGDAGAPDSGEPDGGTNPNIGFVSSFMAPSWTKVVLGSNVQTVFSVDDGATKVALNGLTGTVVSPIGGGTALDIDPTGVIGPVTFSPGTFTKDGAHLLYTTATQALELASATAAGTPTQLAGPGTFADLFGLSPDGSRVLGTLTINPQNGRGDLFLASTAAPGTPVTVSSATTSAINGEPFTADSSHVLFFTNVSKGVGTLNAIAVTGAGTAAALGSNVVTDVATSGAKIVFNDGYNATTGGADLRAVDTSAPGAATLLVTQADPSFALNGAKSTIVYTWSYRAGASAGLWTLAAP